MGQDSKAKRNPGSSVVGLPSSNGKDGGDPHGGQGKLQLPALAPTRWPRTDPTMCCGIGRKRTWVNKTHVPQTTAACGASSSLWGRSEKVVEGGMCTIEMKDCREREF